MSSSNDYDVILLGGGAPGEHCAAALAARGLSGAVVERELVGGECSYWACIPSRSLLRPGEAVQGACEAGARAEIDAEAALAWRDFMVSGYSDDGQERWQAQRGIALLSEVPRTAAYTHAYAESNGFLTLLSDGERLTGAYALGPEAGAWMQQATLVRAHVPLEVLSDTIQPSRASPGSTTRR